MENHLLKRKNQLTADINFLTGALNEVNMMIAESTKEETATEDNSASIAPAPQAPEGKSIAPNEEADNASVPPVDSGLAAE